MQSTKNTEKFKEKKKEKKNRPILEILENKTEERIKKKNRQFIN